MTRALPLLALLAAGCGDINVAAVVAGREGDNCTKTSDCGNGLHCVNLVCTIDAPDVGTAEPTPVDGPDRCGLGPCNEEWLGDGNCNEACNCEAASFDNTDCGNACKNPEDEAALANEGFDPQPLGCWQGCAGNPELTACMGACIQTQGVTEACSGCLAVAVDCTMTNCQEPCQDQQSTPCFDCAETSCGEAFRQCAGLLQSTALAVP